MKSKIYVSFVVLIVAMLLVTPALAITFGEPDDNEHPNVGALIVPPVGPDGLVCSGTLVAPNVFLTAAHCVAWMPYEGIPADGVFVTFDSVNEESGTFYPGTYHLNPKFGHDFGDLHDVAVIVLDDPITSIIPAELPSAGLLDDMKDANELKKQAFVTVGYGRVRDDKTGGWQAFEGFGERRYANQTYNALTKSWLKLSMNPSTGDGGTCYGDSGGPHFLADSNKVVSVTVTGDRYCRATDVTYRIDTDSARSYLESFVDLP